MATTAVASRGRDISHYQGIVDWTAVKARDHITWCMCKATQGLLYTDPTFATNYANAAKAGLVRGGYHYADPSKSAVKQAKRLVALVRPVAGRDFLCLDLEGAPVSMTQAQVRAWRQAFSAQIRKSAPGVSYGIYIGGYAHNGSGSGIGPDECDWWMYPRYATTGPVTSWPGNVNPDTAPNTTGFAGPQVWQFSPNVHGFDASVSTLTATQLADPRAASDPLMEMLMAWYPDTAAGKAQFLDDVGHASAAYKNPDISDHDMFGLAVDTRNAVAALTPEAIAAAVIAALPPAETGGLTIEQIEQAFAKVLTGGTAAVPVAS